MHSGSLARRYALSLLEVATEQKALERVRAELKLLSQLDIQMPELGKVLSSPSIGLTQKQEFLKSVFGERLSDITQRFLQLLLAKRRITILPEIIVVFEVLWREQHREIMVTVTTAIEPDSQLKEKITKYLQRSTEKEPVITWLVDPSLLGGMQVRWPDRLEDSSLRRKLLEMRQALAEG
jgi:F-type H+-transporting ATPase subunit delta